MCGEIIVVHRNKQLLWFEDSFVHIRKCQGNNNNNIYIYKPAYIIVNTCIYLYYLLYQPDQTSLLSWLSFHPNSLISNRSLFPFLYGWILCHKLSPISLSMVLSFQWIGWEIILSDSLKWQHHWERYWRELMAKYPAVRREKVTDCWLASSDGTTYIQIYVYIFTYNKY
jgi:hypothetical protein